MRRAWSLVLATVKPALERLAKARSREEGELLEDRVARVVRKHLAEALRLYPSAGPHTESLVRSLQGIAKPEVLPVLTHAARSNDALVRWAAFEGLKHFATRDLMPLFLAAVRDRSALVKCVAIEWLTRHGDRTAVPELTRFLALPSTGRHSPGLAKAIVEFLGRNR